MIDATHLKAHRTAASLLKKWWFPAVIGHTKGSLNLKIHVECDGIEKPVRLLLTDGQTSNYSGARHLLPSLSRSRYMIADRVYDADWLVDALKKNGIQPCIPPRNNGKKKRRYSK